MTTMRVVGECFFWYRLTRVFPDKFHIAVKRLCVCVFISLPTSINSDILTRAWVHACVHVRQLTCNSKVEGHVTLCSLKHGHFICVCGKFHRSTVNFALEELDKMSPQISSHMHCSSFSSGRCQPMVAIELRMRRRASIKESLGNCSIYWHYLANVIKHEMATAPWLILIFCPTEDKRLS